VFAFIYPNLIAAFQQDKHAEYRQSLKKLFIQTVTLSSAFVVIALVIIGPLLGWLDKPLYQEQLGMFPWILLASFLYAIGMVPHYALYAQGRDRPLIFSHIAGLAMFIAATWLSSFYWPQLAVPLGLCAAFLLILFWKSLAFLGLTPVHYRSAKS